MFPYLFATLSVPEAEELVATPYRHGNKANAERFFLDGMTRTVRGLAGQTHLGFPVTIYYAFKQTSLAPVGKPSSMLSFAPASPSPARGRSATTLGAPKLGTAAGRFPKKSEMGGVLYIIEPNIIFYMIRFLVSAK